MKKLILIGSILIVFICSSVWALDPFMNYKSFSPNSDENIPVVPDINYAIKQGYVNTYLLVASTNKAITAPTGSKFAVFSANADIWVKIGGVATVPAGDITNGTSSELNPSIRFLDSLTIGVISEAAAKISIMFYK